MSMKIEHDRNGDYSIKLAGMRKRFTAKTTEELTLAIEHYFGKTAHFTRENNWKGLTDCPLCRKYEE